MKHPTFDLTGLVLAGGKSRRFGTDKARYEVDGRAMIDHVIEVVAAVADTVVISIGADGRTLDRPGVRHVIDRYPDAGPLAGLQAGLAAAGTSWMLAVACDMPFLTQDVLRPLVAARAAHVDAVVARTPDGRTHPLCACYHSNVLPVVVHHLATGTLAMHALLDRLKNVAFVDLPATPLRNVNHVVDLDDPVKHPN